MKGDRTYKDWANLKRMKRKKRREALLSEWREWRPWALLNRDQTRQESDEG